MQLGMMSGDNYYIYSEQPFKIDNEESQEGSCGRGYLHHKTDAVTCQKLKLIASGDEFNFRLSPASPSQNFYIIGI